MAGMSRRLVFVLIGLGLALVLVLAGVAASWGSLGAGLSFHGWLAYALGGFVTLGLSVGLFLLSFHSARSGADEAAAEAGEDKSAPRD